MAVVNFTLLRSFARSGEPWREEEGEDGWEEEEEEEANVNGFEEEVVNVWGLSGVFHVTTDKS